MPKKTTKKVEKTEEPEELTVADIEKMLQAKKSKVTSLQKKKQKLQQQIMEIDRQIGEVLGTGAGRVGIRMKNEKSLPKVVEEVLAKHKKGLTLTELMNAVIDTGYQSASQNFKNVVYQCVYHSPKFKHDEKTGKYLLG